MPWKFLVFYVSCILNSMTQLVEDSLAQPTENRVFVKDLEYDYFSNSTCGDFHMKDKK